MEYRPLELTIISAKDLNDVNLFSKMDVYVVIFLSTDPRAPQRTPVDRDGGKSPKWNYTIHFSVPEGPAAGPPPVLTFLLRSDRTLGDRDIGQVHVPIKELLDAAAKSEFSSSHSVTYQVRKPSGKPKGVLNFSFKFGEKDARPASAPAPPAVAYTKGGEEPVMAYPPAAGPSAYPAPYASHPPPGQGYPPPGAYPPPSGYGYGGYPPPPHAGYGYPPPPPQQGYGYPPPPQGYGYQPMVAPPQQPKKNKMGLGLGAGLLGGALGGLLIGDMISDSADAYDAGYDAGLDDAGGFDF